MGSGSSIGVDQWALLQVWQLAYVARLPPASLTGAELDS